MNYSTIEKNFKTFCPQTIAIDNLNSIPSNNLIVYSEVHGARENANVVYTLSKTFGVRCLALEYSNSIEVFIRTAVKGTLDFSLLDLEMFDRSILSVEMLKVIVTLLQSKMINSIKYLDESFDYTEQELKDFEAEDREKIIADNILALNEATPTLCILGNWHTRTRKTKDHTSALLRVRSLKKDTLLINNVYRMGVIRNVGSNIKLPIKNDLPPNYAIQRRSKLNFDLIIPIAHPIAA